VKKNARKGIEIDASVIVTERKSEIKIKIKNVTKIETAIGTVIEIVIDVTGIVTETEIDVIATEVIDVAAKGIEIVTVIGKYRFIFPSILSIDMSFFSFSLTC